jgi:hypothetical protein
VPAHRTNGHLIIAKDQANWVDHPSANDKHAKEYQTTKHLQHAGIGQLAW